MSSRVALIIASFYTSILSYEFNIKLEPGTNWVYEVSQNLAGYDLSWGKYERTITLQSMNPDSIQVFRFNVRDSGYGNYFQWDSIKTGYYTKAGEFDTSYTVECFVGSQIQSWPNTKWGDLGFVFSKGSFIGNGDSVVDSKNGFEKYTKADTLDAFYWNANSGNRWGTGIDINELYALKDVGIIFRKFTNSSRFGEMYSIWELKLYNNKPVNSAAVVNKIDQLTGKPINILEAELKVNRSNGTRKVLNKDRIRILYEGRLLDFLGRLR